MEQVTRTFEEELSTVVIKTDIVIKINMSKLTTKHIQLTEAESAGGVMEVMKTNSTQSIMMSVKKKAKKKQCMSMKNIKSLLVKFKVKEINAMNIIVVDVVEKPVVRLDIKETKKMTKTLSLIAKSKQRAKMRTLMPIKGVIIIRGSRMLTLKTPIKICNPKKKDTTSKEVTTKNLAEEVNTKARVNVLK